MRRLRMRGVLAVAAVVIGASAVTAACGQQRAGSAGSAASAAAGASTRSAVACARPPRQVSQAHPLTLTDRDNGKTVCLPQGAGLFVFLHGSMTRWWSPIKSNSPALAARANGRMMLALGVTGAYFVAARPGTATVTSAKSICGPRVRPTAPTTSTGVHCGGTPMVYKVTLVITR